MKKTIKKVLNFIKYKYLDIFSMIVLFLWTTSPLIEYILKERSSMYYTYYFNFIIHPIGIFGFILYIIHFLKLKNEKKLKINNFIPEILLIILTILSIVSTIFSKNQTLAIFGESYRKEGLIVYILYIGVVLLSSIIHDNKYTKYIFKSIILSGLIITILPFFKNDFTFITYSNVFLQFNHYGYYLMINVMLSAFMFIDSNKLYKKIFYLVVYIFFTYLLIKNNTFGCYLAICISFFLLTIISLIKKFERKNIILLIIVFVLTSFTVSHFDIKIGEKVNFKTIQNLISNNFTTLSKDTKGIIDKDEKATKRAGTGRGLLWKEAWNYTKEHPITGGGMECLNSYYIQKNVTYNDRPHNVILQISSFIGIPGAIVYIIFIGYIAIIGLKYIGKDKYFTSIYFTGMCYFISSIFGNSMYYTSPYFMILLGLLIGFIRIKKID